MDHERKMFLVKDLPDNLFDLYMKKADLLKEFFCHQSREELDALMNALSGILADFAYYNFTNPIEVMDYVVDLFLENVDILQRFHIDRGINGLTTD